MRYHSETSILRYMRIPNLRRFAAYLLVVISVTACEKFDREETIPSYIYISDISVNADYADEGTSDDDISDAWVFVNDQLIGAWELPATVPILSTGPTNIKVKAGVRKNGIAASRIQYPFLLLDEIDVDLVATQVDTLTPVVEYEDGINIDNFTFDNAGIEFVVMDGSDTTLRRTTDPQYVFEGGGSGIVEVDENRHYLIMRTDREYDFPINNDPVYLEFNYKSTNSMAIGMYGYRDNGEFSKNPKIILHPSTDDNGDAQWKKIYVNFTDKVAQLQTFDYFEIYLETNLDQNATSGILLIDNFKVLWP